jgi:hypothetical protein
MKGRRKTRLGHWLGKAEEKLYKCILIKREL